MISFSQVLVGFEEDIAVFPQLGGQPFEFLSVPGGFCRFSTL
jgi:hypothetical protein